MEMEERERILAEVKASIQMLEECKQNVENNEKIDENEKKKQIKDIDEAIDENYKRAKLQYHATKKEIDASSYKKVSEEYKEKYNNRLKAKGLTDEMLQQKEIAVVVTEADDEYDKNSKRRHRRKKNPESENDESGFDPNDIQRIENEEELMKNSMVSSDKELERRRHRNAETISTTPKQKNPVEAVGVVMENKKMKERDESYVRASVDSISYKKERKTESKRVMESSIGEDSKYDFDVSEIPSYIQYDILPLPSNGECYPHKKNRIPVAYLTAADENIIASPNMYRDGKVIDTILERKILDKDIKVEELCKGDRDAIVLWLRATGYGTDFPIEVRHPETKKVYPVNVQLDTFKYYPFNLKGDENGYFDYVTKNGDIIKFKYLNIKDEGRIKEEIISLTTNSERINAMRYLKNLKDAAANVEMNDVDRKDFDEFIADMKDILNSEEIDFDEDKVYANIITNEMVSYTMSVNGNSDRDFIRGYIENMRSNEAYDYRTFVNDNTPGVNMKIKVNVPKGDGGGTFTTFLAVDDYVFVNI